MKILFWILLVLNILGQIVFRYVNNYFAKIKNPPKSTTYYPFKTVIDLLPKKQKVIENIDNESYSRSNQLKMIKWNRIGILVWLVSLLAITAILVYWAVLVLSKFGD
ncbi:hypothetical protein K6119_06360 [Paracrocinitomix mangrovi]|uniref:hypothetical protein n=1 Tax=Paracrocinitomix mangrovi TaxID=2862509 RepID=UPI001C8DAB89|nr:hypothetical protein [Paracrocinitomix mangrovi]UKN03135.1 hypothetical protein K6119_06360 [Paracrocinitomix mangrovi]